MNECASSSCVERGRDVHPVAECGPPPMCPDMVGRMLEELENLSRQSAKVLKALNYFKSLSPADRKFLVSLVDDWRVIEFSGFLSEWEKRPRA